MTFLGGPLLARRGQEEQITGSGGTGCPPGGGRPPMPWAWPAVKARARPQLSAFTAAGCWGRAERHRHSPLFRPFRFSPDGSAPRGRSCFCGAAGGRARRFARDSEGVPGGRTRGRRLRRRTDRRRLGRPEDQGGSDVAARRTTPPSSGGGCKSYEPGKPVRPPPSAAAPGAASARVGSGTGRSRR
jgi:hypothetical protein